MAALTQTITIVDKSNKVVSASKQLKGVFSEAKYAYLARKAEIKAERKRKEEVELQKAIKACSIADDGAKSQVSSVSRRPENVRRQRSEYEGARTHRSGSNTPPMPVQGMSLGQFNEQLYGQEQPRSTPPMHAQGMSLGQFNEQLYGQEQQRSAPGSPGPSPYVNTNQTLQRRYTEEEYPRRPSENPHPLQRSYSATDVDLDLAYGEFNESDLADSEHGPLAGPAQNALAVRNPEQELSGLVIKCKKLLDEADCAGQSVKAIITHLQANPDAMAAVALTLAEISNIAAKVAPTALTSLKATAPAVMALLASPQFLVAVGVGVGVTVVMFGGYKIIKKIKEAAADGRPIELPMYTVGATPRQAEVDQGGELLDVKELDRIEQWRRGIAETGPDIETGSVVSGYSNATSVEGEFITPFAAQSMGHLPLPKDKAKSSSGNKKDKEDKESKDGKEKRRRRKHRDSDRDSASSEGGSTKSDRSKRRESRELVKVSKPSPLRRMFTVHGTSSSTGWEK